MLQMYNENSLTNVCHITKINVQHAIIVVKKVILHAIMILKHRIINFTDICSPNTSYDHHHIINIML